MSALCRHDLWARMMRCTAFLECLSGAPLLAASDSKCWLNKQALVQVLVVVLQVAAALL